VTTEAVDRLRHRLRLTGFVALAAIIASTALNGLPVDDQDAVAVVVVTVVAVLALLLAAFVQKDVPVAALNTVAGLSGALLIGLQPSGPGYLVAFIAIAALGLRLPRRVAVVIGAVILVATGTTEALNSAHAASSTLSIVLGSGFLLLTSAFAAASQESHSRSLELLRQEEATRAAREEAAALAERARLARELHDVLAHTLSGLSLQLEGARLLAERTSADPALLEQIVHAGRLAREGLNSAKSAVATLRGDALPGPAQLLDLVDNACRSGLLATFAVLGDPRPIAGETGLAIYRTVQEALTNTTKYAGRGASVTILLTWSGDALSVEIADSGGVSGSAPLPSGGFGLAGLSERAALAGGRFEAGPQDAGWRVSLTMPFTALAVR
jgi:signal transduction histidine kinase